MQLAAYDNLPADLVPIDTPKVPSIRMFSCMKCSLYYCMSSSSIFFLDILYVSVIWGRRLSYRSQAWAQNNEFKLKESFNSS